MTVGALQSSGKILDNEVAIGHDQCRKTSLRARQGFERYTHNYQLAEAYGNDALRSEAFREARYP